MTKQVTVAATQMSCTRDSIANIENAKLTTSDGAQIILIQELFESVYFPGLINLKNLLWLNLTKTILYCKKCQRLQENSVFHQQAFLKKTTIHTTTSQTVIDADGSISEPYRKSHIIDGPGYEEKYYFHPGNTGFKVLKQNSKNWCGYLLGSMVS